ncbi:MAG: hypothetical protein LBM87_07590 [Ruminococcus sp.]|jgi:hypothetical protein|nr:hypothetical protein [Ruminococcus sp.]
MPPNTITEKLAEQLSYDYNCSPYDFFSGTNSVTESLLHPGRRRFSETADIFKMATIGGGTIISCLPELTGFSKEIAARYGDEIFSQPALSEISTKISEINLPPLNQTVNPSDVSLSEISKKLSNNHTEEISEDYSKTVLAPQFKIAFLPKKKTSKPNPTDIFYDIRVFEGDDVKKLYGYSGFENALCRKTGKRRDVLAVCAFYGGEIIGIAGASNDSRIMWQIGIDVDWRFKNNGIAKTLVGILTEEIFAQKKIPYYVVSPSNIPSLNTAISCGYSPSFAEVRTGAPAGL